MPLHLTKQLSRAIQDDSSKCVLFVGAGLSASGIRQAGNGLPDWDTLMQHMIDDLRDSEKCDVGTLAKLEELLREGKHLEIARTFKQRTRPDQFAAFLKAELDPPDITLSKVHEVILKTNFRGIITTNFDMVFEYQSNRLQPLVYPQCLDDIDSFRRHGFFAKIHGCIRNTPSPAENLILTEESYAALRSNYKYQTILRSLFVMHPVLTVGFSLRDPDFLGLIGDLREIFGEVMPTVYALMLEPDHKARDTWREKGVEIIPYTNHTELVGFFEEMLHLREQKHLSLATDASKRASKSLENRLIKTMESLNKDSLEIIVQSQAFYDDKNLTTDNNIRSEIHRICRKIEGLEINLVILEDSNIKLEPYCNFIRGADSYLSEQFNQAIKYWTDVTLFSNDNKLKSLAYFWIGYINNNLGNFTTALSNFKKAQELAVDSRKYELLRIQLETRFFNNENPVEIVKEFVNLILHIDRETTDESITDRERRKIKILTTLGNIYHQMGNEANSDKERLEYYQKSKDIFTNLLKIDESKDVFNQIYSKKKDSDKWIIFGYAESIFLLGQKDLAKRIFKDIVYHLAENEYINRVEKRTKTLAKTTQLICATRTDENEIVINNTKSQVDSALCCVDKRLTIYSQIQRRNVSRNKFTEDINKLLGEKVIA